MPAAAPAQPLVILPFVPPVDNHSCREIFRVLKPGARFASCDWAMTEKYRDNDPVRPPSPTQPPTHHLCQKRMTARLLYLLCFSPFQVHKASKEGILLGNGLPDLRYTRDIVQALKDVGFEARN